MIFHFHVNKVTTHILIWLVDLIVQFIEVTTDILGWFNSRLNSAMPLLDSLLEHCSRPEICSRCQLSKPVMLDSADKIIWLMLIFWMDQQLY